MIKIKNTKVKSKNKTEMKIIDNFARQSNRRGDTKWLWRKDVVGNS